MTYEFFFNFKAETHQAGNRISKHGGIYSNKKRKNYIKKVQAEIKKQLPDNFEVSDKNFVMSATFCQKKAGIKHDEWKYKNTRPDLANLVKIHEDCFNKILYKDDSQIIGYKQVAKLYTDHTCFMIEFMEV